MDERLIVALDAADRDDALRLAEQLAPVISTFKVGLELFAAHGPLIVRELAATGSHLFLDLKLHDIPNTVGRAICSLRALPGLRWLTVHTAGGRAMLDAAVEAAGKMPAPAVVGVTVLTSLGDADLGEIGVSGPPAAQVQRLADLALRCRLGGLVCSPREVALLRQVCGPDFPLITPGIRPAGAPAADQKRVATPAEAIEAGASHLVVGRPITAAAAPLDAARRLLDTLP
ncbi:MAG: orotidine-5'-phosphate decarboxylase [Acidobacteriota bacterium]